VAGVISDHEWDMACATVVVPYQPANVDAGHSIGGDRPGEGHRPVAAVDQAGGALGQAGGLTLRPRPADRPDLPGAGTGVIPQTVDVDAVVRGGGLDLEVDRLTRADTDICGKALDRPVASPVDVPLTSRIPRFRVLTDDWIGDRWITWPGSTGWRRQHWYQRDGHRQEHPPDSMPHTKHCPAVQALQRGTVT
jgi:hypothetical protein